MYTAGVMGKVGKGDAGRWGRSGDGDQIQVPGSEMTGVNMVGKTKQIRECPKCWLVL